MSLYNYSNKNCYDCDCDCEHNEVCTPDKVDKSCSLNSIRKTLIEIIKAVKKENLLGFNVDVEITTTDGIKNTINFSKQNIDQIEVKKATLIAPGIAISLCDIAKITVLTENLSGSSFKASLLKSIKNITTTCSIKDNNYFYGCGCNDYSCNDCKSNSDVECAQGIQNYINENINSVDTVSYNGSSANVQTVNLISDVTKIDVLENSTLNTSNVDVLKDASLQVTKIPVVSSVKAADIDLVTDVSLDEVGLLSNITTTNTDVSAPIVVSPVSVVSDIETTEENNVVTSIDSTTKNVVNQVSSTTEKAIIGFDEPIEIEGVISNVDTIKNITPTSINIPSFTSNGTGELKVIIKAKSIDGTNPKNDIVLNVLVNGQTISFNGNTSKYVLNDNTSILGGATQTPKITTITELGTPITDLLTKTVTSTTIPVVDTVTANTTPTKLISNVKNIDINNIETPTTKTVVENIEQNQQDINVVSNISKANLQSLISTTSENVVNNVTLSTDTENVLNSAILSTEKTSVINNIDTSEQSIYVQEKENIDGNVFTAGDGIMGVNNTNGDITIYSICDINTVNIDD